jgi:hypothetical protein
MTNTSQTAVQFWGEDAITAVGIYQRLPNIGLKWNDTKLYQLKYEMPYEMLLILGTVPGNPPEVRVWTANIGWFGS